MKISRIIFASLLLCFFGTNFIYSQTNAKKDKSKDGKSALQPVEVRVNLMVLDADGKFADVKPEELKLFEDGVEQKIAYFAKKEDALSIGLVVDNSGSMRRNLDEAMRIASAIASNLRAQDEAFIVRFVDSDTIEMIQNWTSDKKELNSAIEGLYVEGGQSAIIDAIYLSAETMLEREKQNKSRRYALLLISDGEELDSYYKAREMFALFKGSDAQIYMLSYAAQAPLAPKKATKLSVQLAFETGGATYILDKRKTKI